MKRLIPDARYGVSFYFRRYYHFSRSRSRTTGDLHFTIGDFINQITVGSGGDRHRHGEN